MKRARKDDRKRGVEFKLPSFLVSFDFCRPSILRTMKRVLNKFQVLSRCGERLLARKIIHPKNRVVDFTHTNNNYRYNFESKIFHLLYVYAYLYILS